MNKRRLAVSLFLSLATLASAIQAQTAPRRSPEFVINMVGGKPILLSSYKGKAIVLAFILTTCPHCQHTVSLLTKLQNELGPHGLQVLACAVQESPEVAVPLFIKDFHPSFPVGFTTDTQALMDYYQFSPANLPMMPMLAFIDRQFTIRAQHQGREEGFFGDPQQEQNLRGEIENLLKVSNAKRTTAVKKGN